MRISDTLAQQEKIKENNNFYFYSVSLAPIPKEFLFYEINNIGKNVRKENTLIIKI